MDEQKKHFFKLLKKIRKVQIVTDKWMMLSRGYFYSIICLIAKAVTCFCHSKNKNKKEGKK